MRHIRIGDIYIKKHELHDYIYKIMQLAYFLCLCSYILSHLKFNRYGKTLKFIKKFHSLK